MPQTDCSLSPSIKAHSESNIQYCVIYLSSSVQYVVYSYCIAIPKVYKIYFMMAIVAKYSVLALNNAILFTQNSCFILFDAVRKP